MQTSTTFENLAAALVKAHAGIKAVVKDASNPFFKSKYATLDGVVDAVKPALLAQGIVVVQGVQDAENGVAIETMLLHSSGQWMSSTLRLPASKEDAQGYGSAISYGRRYGLMAICGVPAADDDGNAATATAKPISVAGEEWGKLSTDQQTQLQDIVDCVKIEIAQKGLAKAADLWESETAKLEATHKVAAWSRFDSKERSGMKATRAKAVA